MSKNLELFFLGSLFSYASTFSRTKPYMHVISLFSLFTFIYRKLQKSSKFHMQFDIDLHERMILVFLLVLEYNIFKFLRFCFLLRIGALLCLFGFILSCYTLYYLNNNKEKGIRYGGPFMYMRHPFYSGVFILIFGSTIYCSVYLTLIYFIFMYKSRIIKDIEEEENELEKIDGKYQKYMHSTKKFFYLK